MTNFLWHLATNKTEYIINPKNMPKGLTDLLSYVYWELLIFKTRKNSFLLYFLTLKQKKNFGIFQFPKRKFQQWLGTFEDSTERGRKRNPVVQFCGTGMFAARRYAAEARNCVHRFRLGSNWRWVIVDLSLGVDLSFMSYRCWLVVV